MLYSWKQQWGAERVNANNERNECFVWPKGTRIVINCPVLRLRGVDWPIKSVVLSKFVRYELT